MAVASDSFFEVGKTYLFIGRSDVAMKGRVAQVTDQEIVFTDRYILKHSKATTPAGNDAKAVAIKAAAIAEYIKSKDKASLLEASPLKDIPTSYSRSEMTAVKVEG